MNTIAEIIQHEIYSQLEKFSLLNRNLLIAFSGGPDSVVLLDAVSLLSKKSYLNGTVHAIYVNHGLRNAEELEKEEAFIHDFCRSRSVLVSVIHLGPSSVQHAASAEKTGIEGAARMLRYQKIEAAAEKLSAAVLTAHNQDDQIETVIMRFFQGSGAEGLKGIPEHRGIIYRPMLQIAKKEIYRYLSARALAWSVDSTNEEQSYTRNRLRAASDVFEKLFPGYRQSVLTLSEKMRMAASLTAVTQQMIDRTVVFRSDGTGQKRPVRAVIRTDRFMELSSYERMNMLYAVWNRIRSSTTVESAALPFRDVRTVLEVCSILYADNRKETETDISELNASDRTVLRRMDLTESRIVFFHDEIIWDRVVVPGAKNGYLKVVHTGETDFIRKQLYGDTYIEMSRSTNFAENQSALIYAETAFPVLVRSALPGDSIRTHSGTKRLKELFSSWHVPLEDRWKIPVIEDSSGVQAVLGKYLGYFDRVSLKQRIHEPACGETAAAEQLSVKQPSMQPERHFLVCSIQQFGDDIEQ